MYTWPCIIVIACTLRYGCSDAFVLSKLSKGEGCGVKPSRSGSCLQAKDDSDSPPLESINVKLNEFFRRPVPDSIRNYLDVSADSNAINRRSNLQTDWDVISHLKASPGLPGVPRPLWLVILGSVPTGLLWYGYYKFCVEEELMQLELSQGKTPKGFGGYGTLGPFVYGCLLGPIAFIFHLPGGMQWTNLGIVFIYYTQFLLYDRVNELYRDKGEEEPLTLWWCLPIFFPFDLIVGLRQVHFLSQYYYMERGLASPPRDAVVDLFPFISAPRFTWSEFLLTPSLWFGFLASIEPIDKKKLPQPVQSFLDLGKRDSATK